jgi:hypothetical protein
MPGRSTLRGRLGSSGGIAKALSAGVLAAGLSTSIVMAPALFRTTATPAAATDSQVGLVIQNGAGSTPSFACVPLTSGMNGNDVLKAAKHELTFDKSNFLSKIDNVPATVAAFDAKHPRYWSYWHLSSTGVWAYSNVGADKAHPTAGTVEGWFYFDGATYAPGAVTFAQVCPATTAATPSTSVSVVAQKTTKNSKAPVGGVIVVVVAIAALGGVAVARSRRNRAH